jgi:hypothetical protein
MLSRVHSIDTPPHPKEPTMTHRLTTQATALALSALLTLVMLGGIERLASSQPPAGLVAHMSAAAAHG